MDGWIVIPNWERFQHYDARRLVWIKNYTSLLSNPDYMGLTGAQRALLHGLWLLYAESHAAVPLDTRYVSRTLNLRATNAQLKALNDAGFIEVSASKPLANGYQDASPEKRREVLRTSLPKKALAAAPAGAAAASASRQELLAAANRFTADWNGGGSDAFDEGLYELEQLCGARLTETERIDLWDQVWNRGQR